MNKHNKNIAPKIKFTGKQNASGAIFPEICWIIIPVINSPAQMIQPSMYPQGCFHIMSDTRYW